MSDKENYNIQLEKIIEEDQASWQRNIKDILKLVRSKEPEDMIEGQALGLGYRMMLADKNNYYLSMLVKEEKVYKRLKAKRVSAYMTGMTLDGNKLSPQELRNPLIGHQKISNQQRELVISGELADYEEAMEMLKNAINFNNEVIKTIDSYMFMVKNRLELFNLFK